MIFLVLHLLFSDVRYGDKPITSFIRLYFMRENDVDLDFKRATDFNLSLVGLKWT